MFKNREDYLNQRKTLENTAQTLLNEGKVKEADQCMNQIKDLDDSYEEYAKTLANFNTLKGGAVGTNISNLSNVVNGPVIETFNNSGEGEETAGAEPKEYRNAWAKDLLGLPMSNKEQEAFKMVNAFTHTTENTGSVIPETVAGGIWQEIGEQYPLWNDVFKTTVKGKVTLLKSNTSTDSKWYDEATALEDGQETFAEATLDGCELGRSVTVSWKLKEMSIDEFIPFIQSQLAEKCGAALGYAVAHGKGKPGGGDTFKAEPKGILTVLKEAGNASQVQEYTTEPTYKQFASAIGKIKGAYKNGACVYANGTTIWEVLATIVDSTGRPYFVANPIQGGVGTIFGKIVKEDDGLADGEILIGNAKAGYHANINKQVMLDFEDHKKERATDYIAYGIVDGDVRTVKAWSLLKKK